MLNKLLPISAEPFLPDDDVQTDHPDDYAPVAEGSDAPSTGRMDIRETAAILQAEITANLREVVDHAASLTGQIARKMELAESVRLQTSSLAEMTVI